MSDNNSGLAGLLGFVTGAVIGAGLALLYAPQTGKETRQKIKETSEKISADMKENYEKMGKEAKKAVEQVKVAAEGALENVKSFIDGAKEGMKREIKSELKEEAAAPAKK